MRQVFFVTHPEVTIDPESPVPQWGLSQQGRMRMAAFCAHPFIASIAHVFSSEETKAAEAALILSTRLGLPARKLVGLGENDRSSTGFMPREEFEAAADQFFAFPDRSYLGWETAAAAQRRIVKAVELALRLAPLGNIAIVSHGAVGALLKCHLKRIPITRAEDQRRQGNYFIFDEASSNLLVDWTPVDQLANRLD